MLGSATVMKVSFFRGLNACTISLLPVPVSATLCLKPKSIEMSDKNWPLCVWSSKALWRLTKMGLFGNCISSNCNILNPTYCLTPSVRGNFHVKTQTNWQSNDNLFFIYEHLQMFAKKFQVSYLSFCTANEGENITIKKKEKVCNTTQQLNIAMSFF